MKMMLELRYAILLTLLTLLWLAVEFMVGLQDKYAGLHLAATILAFIIPVVVYRLAIKEKREQLNGRITFRQALQAGLLITALSAVFVIPEQLIFHTLINPDFFDSMIHQAVLRASQTNKDVNEARAAAEMYFNLKSYVIESVLVTLLAGSIIAFAAALRMQTPKIAK
jgi:hypothetical protein